MADVLYMTTPLNGFSETFGSVSVFEPPQTHAVAISVRPGGMAKLKRSMKVEFGLTLPRPARASSNGDSRLIWTQRDQYLLISRAIDQLHLEAELAGAAHITDQTDAFATLILDGSTATGALERICPLDLYDTAFPVGAAHRTIMEHLSVIILREATNRYRLLSPRSSSGSFLDAVRLSCRYAG